ncbi:histone-lysine N-methyltransferase SETMAR [Trichonephila clavipes]|nr:histone-lysine N-methyltransferase SETMAR [Trichonephila clavipes]
MARVPKVRYPCPRRSGRIKRPPKIIGLHVLKIEVNKEKIRYILQLFFYKGKYASQVAEIINGVYGTDMVTADYVQFWFRRFRSSIFDVQDAPHTSRPVDENVNKITEIIKVDGHFFFENGENASQAAEIVNGVYGADTVTAV